MIDINDREKIRKLTLEDMVNDAVERNDKKALRWLEDQSKEKTIRTRKDGTTYEVDKTLLAIRAEYLKKYLGYEPLSKKQNNERAKEKARKDKEQKRHDLFAKAFEALSK